MRLFKRRNKGVKEISEQEVQKLLKSGQATFVGCYLGRGKKPVNNIYRVGEGKKTRWVKTRGNSNVRYVPGHSF